MGFRLGEENVWVLSLAKEWELVWAPPLQKSQLHQKSESMAWWEQVFQMSERGTDSPSAQM